MANGKKQTVLIVEDEPLNISVVAEILESQYELLIATHGEKALQIVFSEIQPDLILLDIVMPGMSGFEVIQSIKNNPKTAHIPIIFLTSKQDNESIVKGFNLGAVDYISKPFQREELLVRIKNTLQLFNLQQALNRALKKSQSYVKTIENQISLIDQYIILSSTDLEGNILDVSEAFCKISGYTKNELIGQNHRIIRHPDMSSDLFENLWHKITNGNTWEGEIKNRAKNGTFYWVDAKVHPLYSDEDQIVGYTKIAQNITDKKRVEELSITDQLTRLHNRLFLEESFVREMKRSRRYQDPFSVIMVDIDHFKEVNDNFGHDVGDNVLIIIADLLKKDIRDTDILGRWGGEEFLIICPHTGIREATILAEHLRSVLEAHRFEGIDSKTCSLGVSEFDLGDDGYKEVIKRADEALYEAKRNGRNQVSHQVKN